MNLAIVDDLASDRNHLKQMITTYFHQNHIVCNLTQFSSGEELLVAYRPVIFDAIFLDNMMEGISGMETARKLRDLGYTLPIIFITTEKSYALEGYTVQAMDYMIKPVTQQRMDDVLHRLTSNSRAERYIELKENRISRQLMLNEIIHVRSMGHFLEIHMVSEDIKPYMSLESFLALLTEVNEFGDSSRGLRFQSSCRGSVLNLEHVRSLTKTDFLMSDGTSVPVSRAKYKEMQAAFAAFSFARTRNRR